MNILLIEDNPGDAVLVRELVRELSGDYSLETVSRLQTGIEYLSSHKIDVVLLDLGLPDSSGLNGLTRLHELFPNLTVIIMTSLDDEMVGIEAMKQGAEDYLVKGQFNSYTLRRTLAYSVERQKLQESLRKMNAELEIRVQQRTRELRKTLGRLFMVQETERRTVARELHDQTGGYLTALKIILINAKRSCSETAAESLDEASTIINEIVTQIRDLSLNLRPAMLDDLGLLPTLVWYFERFKHQTGIQVDFQHNMIPKTLSVDVITAAFRVIQEALTNVARYAEVSQVNVGVFVNEEIEISIRDEGTGFILDEALKKPSSGVGGMRERVSLLSGKIEINTAPGMGTYILVSLPIPKSEITLS